MIRQVWYFFVQILRGIGHHHGTGGGGTGHAPGRQLLAMVIGIQVLVGSIVIVRGGFPQGRGQFHGEALFQLSFLFGKDGFGIFVRSHVFFIIIIRSRSGRKGRSGMFVNSFVQGVVAIQTGMRFVLLQRTLRINHQRRRCR